MTRLSVTIVGAPPPLAFSGALTPPYSSSTCGSIGPRCWGTSPARGGELRVAALSVGDVDTIAAEGPPDRRGGGTRSALESLPPRRRAFAAYRTSAPLSPSACSGYSPARPRRIRRAYQSRQRRDSLVSAVVVRRRSDGDWYRVRARRRPDAARADAARRQSSNGFQPGQCWRCCSSTRPGFTRGSIPTHSASRGRSTPVTWRSRQPCGEATSVCPAGASPWRSAMRTSSWTRSPGRGLTKPRTTPWSSATRSTRPRCVRRSLLRGGGASHLRLCHPRE